MVPSSHDNSFDPTTSALHPSASPSVPQEHNAKRADADSSPRDWSQLGRRVLAEAWRRTTDDVVRQPTPATPADPAPRSKEHP